MYNFSMKAKPVTSRGKYIFKNRTLIPFLFVVFFVILAAFIFYKKNYMALPANTYPVYTPERQKQDAELKKWSDEQRQKSEGPLQFLEVDLTEADLYFHKDISSLPELSAKPVLCLNTSKENVGVLVNPESRTDDENVLKFIKQIREHAFSDEQKVYNEDGILIEIENLGERSIHQVDFYQICKSSSKYFFLFEAYGEKTHIGGGGSAPSYFAFSDNNGTLIINESVLKNSKHIKLPKSNDPDDYSFPQSTGSIAYYGCRKLYLTNDSEVVVGCGGGDGPASAGGIFLINLLSQTATEKVFCSYNGVGNHKEMCFDENGNIFRNILNAEIQN